MELWVKLTNTVTAGNIAAFVFLLSAIILGYYKIRRLIAQQHYAFLDYVKSLTQEQTAHLEECIHKIPAHPENSKDVQNGDYQEAGAQPNNNQKDTENIS